MEVTTFEKEGMNDARFEGLQPWVKQTFPVQPEDGLGNEWKRGKYSRTARMITCGSIITYIADFAWDIYLMCQYYGEGEMVFFGWTLAFVIIPALVMTAYSLHWYLGDVENENTKVSWKVWLLRSVFLLAQLAPVLRFIDSLIYGVKYRKAVKAKDDKRAQEYYERLVNENSDAALLRLFEAYLESAPQAVLQLTFYVSAYHSFSQNNTSFGTFQIGSVILSLASLGLAMASYNSNLRLALPNKKKMTLPGVICNCLWHVGCISARVFALAAFAAVYPSLIILVCVVHWILMMVWLNAQKYIRNGFEGCSIEALTFKLLFAFMYLFTFINTEEERTRFKYLIFYTIMAIENSILILLWYFSFVPDTCWFHTAGLLGVYLAFSFGLLCMLTYYSFLHPNVIKKREELEKQDERKLPGVTHRRSVIPPEVAFQGKLLLKNTSALLRWLQAQRIS